MSIHQATTVRRHLPLQRLMLKPQCLISPSSPRSLDYRPASCKHKLISIDLLYLSKLSQIVKGHMDNVTISPEIARAASDLRAILGRLKRRLRQREDDEITLPQASVLSRLANEGPMTSGALAAADRVRPQSMSSTLAALQAQGLVERRADPNDGRHAVMVLTTSGEQTLQGVRRLREERLGRAIADQLSPEEQRSLIAALPLLDRLVEGL